MLFSRRCHRILKLPFVFLRPRCLNPSFSSYGESNHGRTTTCITLSLSKYRNRICSPNLSNVYNSNVKISDLGRHGKVKEARLLFDEMPERDDATYASMITVYLKNNDLGKAEQVFEEMPVRSIVAESAMVSGYVKAGRINEAREVFDRMAVRNVFSWTSLVSGYFECGQVDVGRRLFDQMPKKNVVSWTSVVAGYARNGFMDEAQKIFDQMPGKNVVAWTVMIKSCIENDRFDEARKLFEEMPQRNLYSWNIMLLGCLNVNRVDEAIRLFDEMPQRNAVSWTTMVTGLAQHGMTKLARVYFDRMPNKDIPAWNAMIKAYVYEGLVDEANELFRRIPARNIMAWNAIIDGYARNGPEGKAFEELILMLRSSFKPDESTISSLLTSCRSMVEVLQAHGLVIPLGFEHETALANCLVTMYSRSGDLNSARVAFENLKTKDTVSWTAMILAYSNHGYGHDALRIFARMIRSGAKPDEVTFVGLLTACSHAGLVKKGQRLFDSIHSYGLKLRSEHYSCLVDILGRAGQLEEAVRVVCDMPTDECDGAVLSTLLGACKLHGNVRLANQIGAMLIEQEPTSSGGYVLLANIYASCGMQDELAQLRKKMKEMSVKKVPGSSQIEVKGKNHVFFVGDRNHPQADEIYGLLLPLMQEMSYTNQDSSVLV